MSKVKLFTHNDLDGVGCAIFGILKYDKENIDIEYCLNPTDCSEKVEKFLSSEDYKNYKELYITDISVNKYVADLLDYYSDSLKIGLFDHHPTALWLNEYRFAKVVTQDIFSERKESGTFYFYNYLFDNISDKDIYYVFAELVRQYDTWDWYANKNFLAKNLNDIYYIKGREKFIDDILTIINSKKDFKLVFINKEDLFSETDLFLLKIEEDKKQKYFAQKQEELIKDTWILNSDKNINIGVVFAEQYTSELGNELSKLNPDLDFIAIVNGLNKVSLRTVKDDINLGLIAKENFNGGGHAKAGGFEITEELKKRVMTILLSSSNYTNN